ncbi:MAG: hypothetical protein ACFFD2_09785 [Promethearchaeota archaeon]
MKKFHNFNKNENGPYLQDQLISPEYLMILLVSILTEIIIKFIVEMKNLPKIVGVIHTKLEINYLKLII